MLQEKRGSLIERLRKFAIGLPYMLKDYTFDLLVPFLAQCSIMLQQLLIIKFDGLEDAMIEVEARNHSLKICYIFLANPFVCLIKPSQEVAIMIAIILDRNCY